MYYTIIYSCPTMPRRKKHFVNGDNYGSCTDRMTSPGHLGTMSTMLLGNVIFYSYAASSHHSLCWRR